MGRSRLLLADPASRGESCSLLPSLRLGELRIDREALRIVCEDRVPSAKADQFPVDVASGEPDGETAWLPRTDAAAADPALSSAALKTCRRHVCEGCGHSRAFWCGSCHQAVGSPEALARIPRLELPLTFHIVRHPKEKATKSSAVPLSILAPGQVHIHMFPDLPPALFTEGDAAAVSAGDVREHGQGARRRLHVLLPDDDATSIDQVNWEEVEGCILLDCTWFQVPGMRRHPALAQLPKISLGAHSSVFWRQHKHNEPCYLSTAECVYYVLLACHEATERDTSQALAKRIKTGQETAIHNESAFPVVEEPGSTKSPGLRISETSQDESEDSVTFSTRRCISSPEKTRRVSPHPRTGCRDPHGFSRPEISRESSSAPDCLDSRPRPTSKQDMEETEKLQENPHVNRGRLYDGRYDNILFYFVLCHSIVLDDQRRRLEERQIKGRLIDNGHI
ncbi:DTW domain-containing protein [Besnoitia besnoiti]|uniref:tRNA-uridine aminocarboxypropyltransferase 1 n=1 Tax=Besnoitia besnoiti TaxID=94643 RepID=A0A2A9M8I6_BESBE|nr:DTW domain-containing protein [Besnoitia besnoiti]PFH34788.1 DTW domain-containing protein [Besnoitia besnoiti]